MSKPAGLKLRDAIPEEAADLEDLCLRSKAHWGYDQAFLDACREELSVSAEAIRDGLVQIAERDGIVAGIAEISFEDGSCWLEKLFIDPASIGTGAGRALFDWSVNEAQAHCAKEMIVEADPDAAPFYRKMGCVDDGEAPSGSIPGRKLPRLVFKP